jgi:uncharacterized RDD family membrane protein YckC
VSALPPPPGGTWGEPALPPPPGMIVPPSVVAYAGFWQRVWARLIDSLLVALPLIPVFVSVFSDVDPEVGITDAQLDRVMAVSWIVLALDAVYEISMIAWRGQTLGKMALGIKVVPVVGGKVGVGWATIRWAVPAAASRLPGVGSLLNLLVYLWMLWDPMKQGLHDKAARTIVIRTR